MDTQENKAENSQDKDIDFKIDFIKIISNNGILVIAITGFIIVITLLYFIADEKSHNNFGDYFGGVLNPILAFISFIAILWTVALQRKSIELQSKELRLTREELEETREELKRSGDAQEQHTKLFEQQQFETTFFNILELLRSYSKKEPLKIDISGKISGKNEKFTGKVSFPNKWTEQYPLTLLSLLDSVKDFTNDKKEITKYINIVKANLDGQAFLITLLTYKSNFMSNQHQINYPYPELKDRIEKYALFDVIPKAVIKDFPAFAEKADYDNIIKFFKLSAFGNNYYLLADRINLEEEPDELVRYATSPYKVVRLAVAKNKKTPIEILEQLSQDENEEVRQAAINTINLLKSQNDENN